MSLAMLAITSGLLQAFGYYVYIQKSLKHELRPNASTWFMFAYGTLTLTVLEWDREANWVLLVLPVTCAFLSVFVAFLCWKRGTLKWPSSGVDRTAFLTDVLLTIAYVSVWILTTKDYLSHEQKSLLVLAFLVLSNASTVVSFMPLMKGALDDPRAEHPFPWLIWASAYATLGYVTYLEDGWMTEFMIYPVLNTILHATVGLIATRRWFRRPRRL